MPSTKPSQRTATTSKRTHSKSRTGCKQCKSRRVKCDETPPCCKNCTKRGLDCEYRQYTEAFASINLLTPQTYRSSSVAPSHVSSSRRSSTQIPSPPISHASRTSSGSSRDGIGFTLEDLGYMNFYTNHTSREMSVRDATPTDSAATRIWQHDVPRLAASNPFLMHAILATGAAHQQALYGSNGPLYANNDRAVRTHYSKAINNFLTAVSEMRPERADAMLCYSILIGQVTLHFQMTKPEPETDAITDFVDLLSVLSGAGNILAQVRETLRTSPIGSCLLAHTWTPAPSHDLDFTTALGLEQLELLFQRYTIASCGARHEEFQHLVEAKAKLRRFYSMTSLRPKSWVYLMSWIVRASTGFATLVQQRNPVALVMTAYWCVPLFHAPKKWFAGQWPRRLLLAIRDHLAGTDWYEGALWPLQETLDQEGNELLCMTSMSEESF